MGQVTDPRTGITTDIPGVDQAMLQDYLARNTNAEGIANLPGNRSIADLFGATASDGGTGGDLDLDGDARIDNGWYAVAFSNDDVKFSRNPQAGLTLEDQKLSGPISLDVGGVNAAALYNALAQTANVPTLQRPATPASSSTSSLAAAGGFVAPGVTLTAPAAAAAPSPLALGGLVLLALKLFGVF